ncbi:MAG: hypothetical protein AAF202_09995, partial [Pseudomonadota bacterium]
ENTSPEGLRPLDYYPPQLFQLPNPEFQYSELQPERGLLFVENALSSADGGRVFLHSVEMIEDLIRAQQGGAELLQKIQKKGLKIYTGYLDNSDPRRAANYMKTWQELAGTSDIDEAVEKLSERYSHVWKKKESLRLESGQPVYTLMTATVLEGFREKDGLSYLNLPRLAVTAPSYINGYREFLFGDGSRYSARETEILRAAYLSSRSGTQSSNGDVFLFDNQRAAQSREAFNPSRFKDRRVHLGLSGVYVEPNLSQDQVARMLQQGLIRAGQLRPLRAAPLSTSNLRGLRPWRDLSDPRYQTPPMQEQIDDRFSMQVFDLAGRDLNDPQVLAEIKTEFAKYGRLHVVGNSKYISELPDQVIESLGFAPDVQFAWGGKDSGRTVRTPKGKGFHSVDKYPATQPLLPHQEILYQRILPKRMLFHYRKVSGHGRGGRTLVHSGRNLERILNQSSVGRGLVEKLKTYGQSIVTGFLDENHSLKEQNFVRSWQDRFQTQDIEQALVNC